jgi:uncharacterized protein (DUF2141 family)
MLYNSTGFSRNIFYTLLLMVIAFFVFSCAKEIAPSGGPQDKEPPVLISAEPAGGTTSFVSDRIIFLFDEYFTLKNPSQTIFFNPLTGDEITYRVKGKKLIVFLPDSLRDNQTYSLEMSDAVADFNEGNLLPSVSYKFATGDYLDSLSIHGKVIEASSAEAKENVNVYLFLPDSDSLLLKKQFAYFATTTTGGHFQFSNLPAGEYYLMALQDDDNNHVFSAPEEMPGFYENMVSAVRWQVNDSVWSNVVQLDKPLVVFQEQDSIQKIVKVQRVAKGLQQIIFGLPVETADVVVVDEEVADSVFTTLNDSRDTLSVWFAGQKADFARIAVIADGQVLDTVSLTLKLTGRLSAGDQQFPLKIKPLHVFDGSRVHHFDTLRVISSIPIREINSDSIFVIHHEDTLLKTIVFSPLNPLEMSVLFDKYPDQKYSVIFAKGAVTDQFTNVSDSTEFMIHTTDTNYYGKVVIQFEEFSGGCHVIEILSGKGHKYVSAYTDIQEAYVIENIIPGEYVVRMIFDNNCNGKWDSGIFNMRRQPEKVVRLPGRSVVKSNWETEIIWTFE